MFSKNVRIVYLYLVALITLFMVIGGIMGTVNTVAAYYIKDTNAYYGVMPAEKMATDSTITNEQAQAQYEQEKKNFEINENNRKIREIIFAVTMVLVATPVYLFYWSKIEKERKESLKEVSNNEVK